MTLFTANFLIFGPERSGFPDNAVDGVGCKTGVWLMPVSEIETDCAAQKQALLAQKAQGMAATEQARMNLTAKYDHNHNGVIDPDEKEEALDDPVFIESELDTIDANHNGILDAGELAYFDANKNKILDPKEQAGIEIAQHLLAENLLKKYDADGRGFLYLGEFLNLRNNLNANGSFEPPFADTSALGANPNGHIGVGALESFLKQKTSRQSLRARDAGIGLANQMQMQLGTNKPVDRWQVSLRPAWSFTGRTLLLAVTNRPQPVASP